MSLPTPLHVRTPPNSVAAVYDLYMQLLVSALWCVADCPGTASEEAGKASACQGCPNQSVCATAPKGPDPGTLRNSKQQQKQQQQLTPWLCCMCHSQHFVTRTSTCL
jgi:hypothetical protein